ncbi:dTDP-4-dehydrorhamnose reductase [Vibrio aerogenes CECT 7868]|uniref:dTDP-4-dehydrorhamnose reductase n=1 Tax=Vibrio aerogenes CECT 7868 TaxID=1216006 RepID=A0A1M5ZCT5_9VIBR|nr:dTDP-4-dehydrorhamnose reductase [Vibrio aerogenes]SHI22016.1 dTDP-4-dehydrorhamnose reductase [Vibrio aerogenes CECT 7868]
MRVLLFGKNGQVGWELQRALSYFGEVIALDSDSQNYCGDFLNPEGIHQTILDLKPDVIVNAAAYTAVDQAETDQQTAMTVNADTVGVIAKAAHEVSALLVHYSTDYVFDGSGQTPWQETDAVAPLNVYGQTKLQGEELIRQYCPKHLIFRTSWVFASRGKNFAGTMLKLAKERETLSIVADQHGAPTSAELLADCTALAVRHCFYNKYGSDSQHGSDNPDCYGLYHLVAKGETTWFDYAKYVFDVARASGIELAVKDVTPVATSEFPVPAPRPGNSRLNTSHFEKTFHLTLPDWQLGVSRMLAETLGSTS